MKAVIPVLALLALIWIWVPTSPSDVTPGPQYGVSVVAHDAAVNFLKLLGEEFQAASVMDAKAAFDHIEDRQAVLRQTVLFKALGDAANSAAYGASSEGEFNQQAFTKAMREIASGLQSVR